MTLITIEKLKKLCIGSKKDAAVIFPQAIDFKHISNTKDGDIVMSLEKPIGRCPKCKEYVFPSLIEEYFAACPICDEDFYKFEMH